MDPNRYAKNRVIRPDGPLLIVRSLVVFALVILGIIGLSVHLFGGGFKPGDFFSWIQASVLNLLLVVAIVIAAYKFHEYISRITTERQRAASNLPMYAMVLVGLYFAFNLLTTGQF